MENGKILFSNGLECVNRGMSVMLFIEKYDIRELLLIQRYNISGNINTIEKAIRNDISKGVSSSSFECYRSKDVEDVNERVK